ncbi:MAG: PfkB family carbohydrate kinase, partial [Defluviitaleaceae bacterium]|nr:PfkB family carbohydrate kinase [Defluviitaleaceae bacterium]
MEKTYDVLTIFDACADIIQDIGTSELRFDQNEALVPPVETALGGSACIFVSGCAKLGLKAAGPGIVGRDLFGRFVLDELKKSGVDVSYICERGGAKTAVSLALCKGGGRTTLTSGDSIAMLDASKVTPKMLSASRHLHIASFFLLTGVAPGLADILWEARRIGLSTSLDTNYDPAEKWELPGDILKNVDIIMPNETEAIKLTREQNAESAARALLKTVKVVALKRGERGASVYADGARFDLPAPKIKLADAVGAGDNFDAGFVRGFLSGYGWRDCLRAGVYCGAASA